MGNKTCREKRMGERWAGGGGRGRVWYLAKSHFIKKLMEHFCKKFFFFKLMASSFPLCENSSSFYQMQKLQNSDVGESLNTIR